MKSPLPAYVEKGIKKKDPQCDVLDVSRLNDARLKELIGLLNKYKNPYFTALKFNYGNITNKGIQHFANMPKQITHVTLSDNGLMEGAAPLLMEVFQHVTHLNISDNHLSREDAAYLAEHSPQIWLHVAGNRNFTAEDMDAISATVDKNSAEKRTDQVN